MFTKAQRTQARLRLALCGPSGSGKTYSALLMAQGLAPEGRIAMIDTERGSGTLYSHLTDYDVAPLAPPFTPDRYIDLIRQAGESGYRVLIIDSLSHAWAGEGGILEMHDRATQASRSGNSFAAWREVTPRHNALVDALIGADLHVIVTMRTKTAYDVTDDGNGKKRPIKVGLAPVQRDGLEYEFTVVMDLSIEGHVATAAKDRTGLFDGSHWVPGPATGAALRDWLSAGVDSADASRQQLEKLKTHVGSIDNVPHLNSWWRANAGVIEQLLPPHVDALKAACAERRGAILDALRAKQEEITASSRRRGPSASAATAH
jgi:hypothetical protein